MKKFMMASLVLGGVMAFSSVRAELPGVDEAYVDLLSEDYLVPVDESKANPLQVYASKEKRDALLGLVSTAPKEEAAQKIKQLQPALLKQHHEQVKDAFARKHKVELK